MDSFELSSNNCFVKSSTLNLNNYTLKAFVNLNKLMKLSSNKQYD